MKPYKISAVYQSTKENQTAESIIQNAFTAFIRQQMNAADLRENTKDSFPVSSS